MVKIFKATVVFVLCLLCLQSVLHAWSLDVLTTRFISPDPLGHSASMDLYSYANGDPLNVIDADGRIGKGAYNGAKDMVVGSGQLIYNAGGSVGYGALSAVGRNDLAQNIYGDQWQGIKDVGTGLKHLGGQVMDGNFRDVAVQMTGGEDATWGERIGYGGVNVAAMFVGGGAGNAGKVGSLGDDAARIGASMSTKLDDVARGGSNLEFSGAPLLQGELKASALLKGDLSTPIYRIAGGDAPIMGRSWTTIDPRLFGSIEEFKQAAGIGAWNTGDTLIIGKLKSFDGAVGRTALPVEGIPNPWAPEIRLNGPAENMIDVVEQIQLTSP